jgi:hypothetical protein
MAQTGYTPILNYSSATASAVPLAANLAQGELALNTNDGKLFYKDSAGVVQTMASKATGSIGGSTTQVQFNNSGVLGGSASLTWSGTVLTSSGFAGPLNGTVGATTANTGAFTTLSATGNVTLGDATTDTVTVNGYMAVGGATSGGISVYSRNTALTGTSQVGFQSSITGSSAGTNSLYGVYVNNSTAAAAYTVLSSFGVRVSNVSLGASSAITNQFGVYINDLTSGTNNYGINLQVSSGTDKWGIYSDGTAQNYLRGNLGLRTATPEAQLDVFTPSGDTGLVVKRSTTMAAAPFIRLIPSSAVAFVDATGALGFRTAAIGGSPADVMRITSSGDVGIGTTTPAANLHVNETDVSGTDIEIVRFSTASGGVMNFVCSDLSSATPTWTIQTGTSEPLAFKQGTSELMRLTSTGLGIGTSSPQGQLDVTASGATVNQFLTGGAGNNLVTGIFRIGSGLGRGASIQGFRGGSSNVHSLDFYTYNSADVFAMRIDSSGNVGIGTSSPAAPLHVFANSGDMLRLDRNNTGAVGNQISFRHSNAGTLTETASINAVSTANADTGTLAFYTKPTGGISTERMRIDSSGNVGIGTVPISGGKISTLADLTAANGLVVRDSATTYANNDNFVLLQNSTGVTVGALTHPAANSLGVWGNDDIRFLTLASATEQMRLTSTGLGIGTTSPSYKLDVAGAGAFAVPSSGAAATQVLLQNASSTSGAAAVMEFTAHTALGTAVGTSKISGYRGTSGSSYLTFSTSDGTTLAEKMRLDSSGDLGLGVTPSAWGNSIRAIEGFSTSGSWSIASGGGLGSALNIQSNAYYDGSNWIYKSTNLAANYYQSAGSHNWRTAPSGTAGNAITFTQAMTLDASGNLLVGTTSAISGYLFRVNGQGAFAGPSSDVDGNSGVRIDYGNSSGTVLRFLALNANGSTNAAIGLNMVDSSNGSMVFSTRGSNSLGERMRIDSSGNLLVGATATSNGGKFLVAQPTAASQSAVFQSTNATAGNNYGILVTYTAASPNGTSNSFVYCSDSTQLRAEFRSNGGLANFSANNANLSDARTKTDIQDAGSYLAKICAIPVRTFKYKDQTDDLLNLGCIAQEVEAVAPELVDVTGFGETPEDGVPLKAIYQTDLQYALMKAIQELKAEFDAYKASHP